MPLAENSESHISEDEYLKGELISDIRHEYINGAVYAMAGAGRKHNLITNNISRLLGNKLIEKNSPCDIFSSDMKIKIADSTTFFFYPDVMVVCDINSDNDYYQDSPHIIIEVLSKSTRKTDKKIKKLAYFNFPSLQEYVLIEQDYCEVEVFRKANHWQSGSYFLGDEITLESINTTVSVEDIYYHVINEDINEYLQEKSKSKESPD